MVRSSVSPDSPKYRRRSRTPPRQLNRHGNKRDSESAKYSRGRRSPSSSPDEKRYKRKDKRDQSRTPPHRKNYRSSEERSRSPVRRSRSPMRRKSRSPYKWQDSKSTPHFLNSSRHSPKRDNWKHDGGENGGVYISHHYHGNRDKGGNNRSHNGLMPEFLERRREERERICEFGAPECWGSSPMHGHHSQSESSSSEKEESDKSDDSDSDTDSSEEDRKKKKKKSKKHRKNKKQSKKKSKKTRKAKKSKERKKKKKRKKSETDSESEKSESEEEEAGEVWVEKKSKQDSGAEEEDIYGPVQYEPNSVVSGSRLDYGKALLPGEGAAMAAYIAEGKRIPRRGEIGLTSDEIDQFEKTGYVMSGSRHRRMEAVRLRKENQIYSADEKRALALFNHDERSKRETKILSQFKEMVRKKIDKNS